jgi:hypothetical protein
MELLKLTAVTLLRESTQVEGVSTITSANMPADIAQNGDSSANNTNLDSSDVSN